MPDPVVIHVDLELFLVNWYRAALAARPEDVCQGVEVDNREPGGDFPRRLVVIRDDSGPDTSLLTGERTVGISVLAGDPENPKEAADLAAIVHALRTQIPSTDPDNPVAAVLGSLGPHRVPESQPRARRYMTVTLSVVGKAL
ncbi:hypothetical protein CH252_18770 [Rhodococcus sp. 06-1477-1B]|nr:hypothetical protein CH252_18770 [Rhodococcus sp. 06-1477-1B]